jgi:phosphopantetheinyl transferase
MDVYWLEQTEADLPEANDWLSSAETVLLDRLNFAPRRTSWRLGRWTLKCALASHLDWDCSPSTFRRIEIRAASSGAPEAYLDNKPSPFAISLSHRNRTAFCVLAAQPVEIGCDVEAIEPHSEGFVRDYFTAEEQDCIRHQPVGHRQWLTTLLWSAKESTLKALHEGLRLDTRCVLVKAPHLPADSGWNRLEACHTAEDVFRGWWRIADDMVRTIVAAPPPASPLRLNITHPCILDRGLR